MKQIKIYKELWDKIVSGEKKYEFRKLSKGLETGFYKFVDAEPKYYEHCMHCLGFPTYADGTKILITDENHDDIANCIEIPREIFGTAKLTAIGLNPRFYKYQHPDSWKEESKTPDTWYIGEDSYYSGYDGSVDEESYEFVKEMYLDTGIDFVIYKISEVKESE